MYKILLALVLSLSLMTPSFARFKHCNKPTTTVTRGLLKRDSQNTNVNVVVQQQQSDRNDRGNRGNGGGGGHSPGWGHGPSGGEVIGGLIIGNAISNWLFPPRPIVVVAAPPPPEPVREGPAPWTSEWYDYCNGKYKSFDAKTGYFTGYDGVQHFCR